MSYHYGFLVETMVSILCCSQFCIAFELNKQLRLLKADEQSLRATISELVAAGNVRVRHQRPEVDDAGRRANLSERAATR